MHFDVLFSTLIRIVSRMSDRSWPDIPRILMIALVGSDLKFSNSPIVTVGSLETASLNFLLRAIALSIMVPPSYFKTRTQLSTSAKRRGLGLVVFNRW